MTPDPGFLDMPDSGVVAVSDPSAIHPFHSIMGHSLRKAVSQIDGCVKSRLTNPLLYSL